MCRGHAQLSVSPPNLPIDEALYREMLSILVDAWGGDSDSFLSGILHGMARFLALYQGCLLYTSFSAPASVRISLLKLKVLEILIYLSNMKSEHKELTQYFSQQTELIKGIRQQLTEHLEQRFTIEELSKQYLINTSTLKEVFKAVYGLPIATYMKEYRVHQAMKLLRETDATIADIAAQVGYETQGKFSKAFKDVTQVLPTEYRKMQY